MRRLSAKSPLACKAVMTREHIHQFQLRRRVMFPWQEPDATVAEVAGVVVECLTEAHVLTLSIEHGHRSHEEVLDAIGGALWEAGWTFAESKITEMVAEAVEQAV